MRAGHFCPAPLALAALAALAACASSPEVVTRTVTMHVPAACVIGARPYGLFYADGDFQPAPGAPADDAQFLDGTAASAPLSHIPDAARSLVLDVSDLGAFARWTGISDVPAAGDVDVLLWPAASPCALSPSPALATARTDAAIGALDARHVLVAGGRGIGAVPSSFIVDLATGAIGQVSSDLLSVRAKASITTFGDGSAVVAGGVHPDSGELLASAEIYGTTGGFDGAPILLGEGRADHASVPLASGEALLLGGMGAQGPLGTLEVIDPKTRRARSSGLAALDVPRSHPTALRLASGEILVAGGLDGAGNPVGMLEWLSSDGLTHTKPSYPLVAGKEQGFVALPGGGALAVIAPDKPTDTFQNVWVISATGAVEAATPFSGVLTAARLFAGNRGAPALWTGARWLRWQPWSGEFGVAGSIESNFGPRNGDILSAPDGGLALWITAETTGTFVYGLRFDARSAYTTDSARAPLLVDDAMFFAPDRLVGPGASTSIAFDSASGLSLASGASAFLADATFASFALDFSTSGASTPHVVLRDAAAVGPGAEVEIGGPACPLPSVPAMNVHVERDGASVSVTLDGAAPSACTPSVDPNARVTIGVRGGASGSVVRSLSIERLEPASP